jgi:hypothetical protein
MFGHIMHVGMNQNLPSIFGGGGTMAIKDITALFHLLASAGDVLEDLTEIKIRLGRLEHKRDRNNENGRHAAALQIQAPVKQKRSHGR